MKRWVIMLGVGAALFSSPVRADSDSLIEGAKLCTAHLPHYEREYGIPTHLLSAIASTESGRYHSGLKIRVPWPWTINANGKGYVFDSKAQAVAAVKRLKAHGVQSIDIGCMQVNIYHHPEAFSSLEQAFDPEANIAYAAGFLRGLYDEQGSWKKAAADYHSRTPFFGRKYVSEVYTSWYQIIDKLRAARLQVPESSIQAMNELKGPLRNAVVKVRHAPEKPTVKTASYHRQENVIVVKPEITLAESTQAVTPTVPPVAVAAPQPQYIPKITVSQAQQVPLTLEELAPAAGGPEARAYIPNPNLVETAVVATRKTGPNFIFND